MAMITYAHKDDPKGPRFRQDENDKLPPWAYDVRKDGHIIYIIKHVHPHTIKEGWDGKTWQGSGDCSQFERRNRDMTLFDEFKASGDVWQQYGIHATFNKDVAQKAAIDMYINFPEYHFAVEEVEIMQKTKMVTAILSQHK